MVFKAELHCHIEGSAHPELVQQKARQYGVDVSDIINDQGHYYWDNFHDFLKAYDKAASVFRTPVDYVELTQDYLTRLADDGCIYSELFVSSDHAARIGCDYPALIEAIAAGMDQAKAQTGIEARIIVVGVRHQGPQAVINSAQEAVNHPHRLVTGFGMAGDETLGRPEDFKRAFDIAREAGLGLTAHAGEICGADSVREALDHLGVSRIGHGVRAIEDRELVKRLAREQVLLETCPGSNIALGVFDSFASHPFKALDEAGCIVTLNSDDPPHFHTSLQREYDIASDAFGYGEADLKRFTQNAINGAFVDEPTRLQLLAKLG